MRCVHDKNCVDWPGNRKINGIEISKMIKKKKPLFYVGICSEFIIIYL